MKNCLLPLILSVGVFAFMLSANACAPNSGYNYNDCVHNNVINPPNQRTNFAPYERYAGVAYSTQTGVRALTAWQSQPDYKGGENQAFKDCKKANNNKSCDGFVDFNYPKSRLMSSWFWVKTQKYRQVSGVILKNLAKLHQIQAVNRCIRPPCNFLANVKTQA